MSYSICIIFIIRHWWDKYFIRGVLMMRKYVHKESFAVIGKEGIGPADKPQEWVMPLWDEANAHFEEIGEVIRKGESGAPLGIWGAMSDVGGANKRWGDTGKYMACCEADVDAVAPDGWTKWIIPGQTYLVADCTMDTYGEVFGKITGDPAINIVAAVHERYPEPGNPSVLELYFPIADGVLYCQSCGMPLSNETVFGTGSTENVFGTEADGGQNLDYCCYCYENGAYTANCTMEEMIEFCVPHCCNGNPWPDEGTARAEMLKIFPALKRWKK